MSSLFKSTLNTRALPTGDLRYIRSDCPYELTQDEIQWLLDNNVTTVVDLREPKEYEPRPSILESLPEFTYHHLPATGGGDAPKSVEDVGRLYLMSLDEQMDRIIDTIMNASTNVIYFCTAGKDRTGVVSALIMKKLGFSEDEILADYMLTKDNMMGFLTAYVEEHPEVDIRIITPNEDNIRKVLAAW